MRLPHPAAFLRRNPVLTGLLGLGMLGGATLAAYRADDLPIIGAGRTYSAYFTEAAGLVPGNQVKVAGVDVGQVTAVALDGAKVKVSFKVKNVWVGDASTAAIAIRTLLGDKYLALDPLGTAGQDPHQTIALTRTTAPLDVTEALSGLATRTGQIDSTQLADSFEAIAKTFQGTPTDVRTAADGLSALAQTVADRDNDLAKLLQGTKKLSGTLVGQSQQYTALLQDGDLLLGELQTRRDAIHAVLVGTEDLSTQLSGLVADDDKQLSDTLTALDRVTGVLQRDKADLDKALALVGPYYRLIGNTLGNGRWLDTYVCGLVPQNYLPAGSAPGSGCIPPKTGGGR